MSAFTPTKELYFNNSMNKTEKNHTQSKLEKKLDELDTS